MLCLDRDIQASDCGPFVNRLKLAEPGKPWKTTSMVPGELPDIGSPLYYVLFCGLSSMVMLRLVEIAMQLLVGIAMLSWPMIPYLGDVILMS
jgi:hypothetical protein